MPDPAPPAPRRPWLRWVTVGEIVGVGALIMGVVSFCDSHVDRVRSDRIQAADERRAVIVRETLLLTGAVEQDGARLSLRPSRAEQVIQSQTLTFPTELRADPVQTTGDARVEAGWIASGAAAALRRIGDPHAAEQDHRLPVAVETAYVVDGDLRTDRAIYRLGYRLQPRLLGGPVVKPEGVSLVRRGVAGDLRARIDSLWADQTAAATAAVVKAAAAR